MNKHRLAGRLTGALLLLASSAAMADTKATGDVSLNGGYASNPYGSSAGGAGSATLNAIFAPSIIMTSPTGVTSLTGQVSHTEYAQRYSGTTDYNVSGLTTQKISALTSLTASLGFNSQVSNSLYPIIDQIGGLPTNPDAPIIVDPSGSATFAERIESFRGSLGLSTSLSPRDTLSGSARFLKVTYPSGSIVSRSFTSYGGGLTYQRSIGPNTSVGLSVDANRADYRAGSIGDSTQISPQLVFNTKLAPRLSVNLAAGLTLSDTDVTGGSSKRTSFSGSASLCNTGDRSSLCADVSRSVSPSSIAGTSALTAFGASYRYQLDTRSQLTSRLSYSRARSLDTTGVSSDYGQGSLGYSRQLTRKLSATVQASYTDTFNSSFARAGNFYGTVGITYRLGEL